jgi:hypothetical protein
VLPPDSAHTRDELGCDAFAVWAAILAEAGRFGTAPNKTSFHAVLAHFVFWQLAFFLFRLAEFARIETAKQLAKSDHPTVLMRADAIFMHLARIGDYYDAGWKSRHIQILLESRRLLLTQPVQDWAAETVLNAFQLIDSVRPGSNPDRVRSTDGSPSLGYAPSVFESLWWECLGPLAEQLPDPIHPAWQPELERYTETWYRPFPHLQQLRWVFEDVGSVYARHYAWV